MKAETPTSPTRLPPALAAPDSRQATPSKAPLPTPLSPVTKQSSATRKMPPPSAVLLASRAPPSARETSELEAYALRIHALTSKKPRVGVGVTRPLKRVVAVPKLANNNALDQARHADALRLVDAGVYLLENCKTGHCFLGTTWDLRNAEAQSFADLRDGVHAHAALATSFRLYGAASGIRFEVLERVELPVDPKTTHKKQKKTQMKSRKTPAFDVLAMETLLAKRLEFHRRRKVRHCARRLVMRRLVVPLLAHSFPVWRRHALERPRDVELLAAAVTAQSAARAWVARRAVMRRRRHRAATRIAAFFALCAFKRVLAKRRTRRRRHESATIIQRAVRSFLQRRRCKKRRALVRRWLNARRIQRVYRGHRGRVEARGIRSRRRREEAATKIQATTRGLLARRGLARQRVAFERKEKCVLIQACWRGFFTRERVYRPLWQSRQVTQQQETAARRLQAFYRRYFVRDRMVRAAQQHALELEQASRIHAAYKNFLAKKFGWAAMTYKLEQSSATRIQRAARWWFFFARIARLSREHRRDRAARHIQRVMRGFHARMLARSRRELLRRQFAACRVQHVWRLSQALTKLHASVRVWRERRSACCIQRYVRGRRQRRDFLVLRAQVRRERATTRIQSAFRAHVAKKEWRRRLQLRRDGMACDECGDAVATVFSWRLSMELCTRCAGRWLGEHDEVVELTRFRRMQQLAANTQRVYRGFQARAQLRFGVCEFCEQRAVRVACRVCPGTRGRFCHSCDALFHASMVFMPPHSDRLRVEAFERERDATIRLQTHWRRHAQRDTLSRLRHSRQTAAAASIQRAYVSRRQRRHTRALVTAKHELIRRQQAAECTLQRLARGFLARRLARRLRCREQSAIVIQRVFRGYLGRQIAFSKRRRRDAAVSIQRHVRGVQARHLAQLKRVEAQRLREQRGAIVIQRVIRGWLVRRRCWHARRARAATTVQSAWRRDRAKRLLRRLVHARNERLRLEAEQRERERIEAQRERERAAATKIQSLVRRFLARRELVRRRVERARCRREEQLAVWIAVERASAVRIQRFVRRQWLSRAAQASLQIQRCARRWLARRELHRLRVIKKAVVCIQRAFRYSRAKRKLTRLVSLESLAVAGSVGGWVELFDEESGCVYYYNRETMASQWVKPPEFMGASPDEALAEQYPEEIETNEPPEWVEYWDETVGTSYYYNTRTGEATWAAPDGVTSNQSDDAWAWPPGAPVDGKAKFHKEAAAVVVENNQSETEIAPVYYYDEQGNAYAYDYSTYGYENNSYAYYDYDAAVSGGAAGVPANAVQGFDESPVDTSYDINYEIYMTQLQRDAERRQQQEDDEESVTEWA